MLARARSILLTATLVSVGCGEPARPAQPAQPAQSAPGERGEAKVAGGLAVAVAGGCVGLFDAPACLRREGAPLQLWLEGDWRGAVPTLRLRDRSGEALDPEAVAIEVDDAGTLWTLPAALEAAQLTLQARDGPRFDLALARPSLAYRVFEVGLDGAPTLAELDADRSVTDPRERFVLRCRIVRRGGPSQAEAKAELLAEAEGIGDVGCRARIHGVAAHQAIDGVIDLDGADEQLRALEALAPLSLSARFYLDYYAALLAQRLGQLDESQAGFERARELAARSGEANNYCSATIMLAQTLARLGRFEEAEAQVQDTLASPLLPAMIQGNRSRVRTTAAWVRILHREQDPRAPDPSALLREALSEPGLTPRSRSRAQLNLALVGVQSGRIEDAALALAKVEGEHLSSRDLPFFALVEARIAHARGHEDEAFEALARAESLATFGEEREHLLRMILEGAELRRRSGRHEQALAAYARAGELADALALGIAADAGRSLFATSHSPALARQIELLLERERPREALCTILGARARHLRALSAGNLSLDHDPARSQAYRRKLADYARQRGALAAELERSWALPADEKARFEARAAQTTEALDALLREATAMVEQEPPPWRCEDARPPADEKARALLTMFPGADRRSWWFLLERGGEIEVLREAGEDPRALAEGALAALVDAGALEQLDELTLVPTGALIDVDFHSLGPWTELAGAPRLRYGLALGVQPQPQSRPGPTRAVVLAGDPMGLAEAPVEAREVREALGGTGWALDARWRPEQDGPSPALLHYSGHGRHAGLVGWDSALLIEEDRPLSARGLLAHRRAPAIVVLGACDAGTSDPRAIDGGMNMATAFLLAGAELVIAPRDAVDDRLARDFAAALYRDLPLMQSTAALGDALVARLSALQREQPRFASWRAWAP